MDSSDVSAGKGDRPDRGVQLDSLTDSPNKVNVEQAIRERLRLHPQAQLHEIVAMLEFEGTKVSSELVERIQREEQLAPH
jgi:hypothetical protein